MKWKIPPVIKIYEALGALADGRVKMEEDETLVYSSGRYKHYNVVYDKDKNAIMANDNGSYWQRHLGYPSIAVLMKAGVLEYRPRYGEALKGIFWKDINNKYKNDYAKTRDYVDGLIESQGIELGEFHEYIEAVLERIRALKLKRLGKPIKPPRGY